MVRGQGKQHILSVNEVEGLKSEKRELESTLAALEKDGYGVGTQASSISKEGIQKQIKFLDRAIDQGSPKKMTGYSKDKIADEARVLEEKIRENMPSRDEMDNPRRHPGVIQKQVMWEKRNALAIERWKQIQRQLNPQDPTCSSVEKLRRS